MKFFLRRRRKLGAKPLEFKHIAPNMVTSGNLLCGLFSLILILHGRVVPAAWLVFFAVIFDGFDGKVAILHADEERYAWCKFVSVSK